MPPPPEPGSSSSTPGGSGRIPFEFATEFHFCPADTWLIAALENASPCDPEWLGSWQLWEERAQAAIAGALGSDLGEPQVARAVHRCAAESEAALVVSASMPMRDLEWFAFAVTRPPVCSPIEVSTGSTGSSRRH